MDTLHKRLSEIRELRSEELDLVGGGESTTGNTTWETSHYNTTSWVASDSGPYYNTQDDAAYQQWAVD